MYRIIRFFKKICKILTFLPVLWMDEDWDFSYLLGLTTVKLIYMKKYFKNSGIVVESENQKIINGIETTLNHIENYIQCEMGNYDIKPPFEVTHKSVPSPDHEGCTQFVTLRKDTGKELTAVEEQAYVEYLKSTLEEEEKCWNAIWDTIKAEGRNWWD